MRFARTVAPGIREFDPNYMPPPTDMGFYENKRMMSKLKEAK